MERYMGFVHIKVGITNKNSDKFSYYSGLIDTGATKPILPTRIAEELGIEKGAPRSVMTGNGLVTMYEGVANFEIEGYKLTLRSGYLILWRRFLSESLRLNRSALR